MGKISILFCKITPVQDKIKGFNRVDLDNSHNWEILHAMEMVTNYIMQIL